MKHDFSIITERFLVSPLLLDDAEALRILRNLNRQRFITKDEISAEAQRVWYSRYLGKPDDYMFKISLKDDPAMSFLGACGLYDVNMSTGTAEFGRISVDTEKAPRGCGTEFTKAVCRLGFEKLKLERIILDVWEDNPAAIRVYEKVGFKEYDRHDGLVCMELKKNARYPEGD